MEAELEHSHVQKVKADNHSIANGEINISGTVTGNIHIGHIIIQAANARLRLYAILMNMPCISGDIVYGSTATHR